MPTPPNPAFSLASQHRVRPGVTSDALVLDAWLQTIAPLPVPAARARRLMLDSMLAQGGQGVCLLVEGPDGVHACLPVALIHSLSFAGLTACATEWWTTPGASHASGAWLVACLETLADWCRAHGIRQILLAPALVDGSAGVAPPGLSPHASGMWHRQVPPAAKTLG